MLTPILTLMVLPFEVAVLEGISKVDALLLLHRGCGVLQHPGGRVVAWADVTSAQLPEVGDQVAGAFSQGPAVQGAPPSLQQQQLIKRLQSSGSS